jgi:6-pyruvoyltetrahydropterin/6-carboxytetrahydropterin synthase
VAYLIRLEKENFKFSGTHFTIFSPDRAERLHGHNYYVAVEFSVKRINKSLGLAFDFNLVKPIIRETCTELDEFVLLPARAKYLSLKRRGPQIHVEFAGKRYEFPIEDVRELPIVNITSEELAKFLATKIKKRLPKRLNCSKMTVVVQESRGQSAAYTIAI